MEEKSQILRKLKDFQPGTAQVRELKILLHGPVGAGKSSFINSVNTVLQGYNTTGALAASSAGKSFTVEVITNNKTFTASVTFKVHLPKPLSDVLILSDILLLYVAR